VPRAFLDALSATAVWYPDNKIPKGRERKRRDAVAAKKIAGNH
jgi:hypothetical protein